MDIKTIEKLIGRNATILEIGCADGQDTRKLLSLGKVYGFEPDKRNIEILKNIKGLDLFEGVISDIDGEIEFFVSKNERDNNALSLSGSIMKPKKHLELWDWISFNEKIKVKSTTLDTFCKDIPVIDFIWCDVQGAEEKVILGGVETFNKVKYFYTEYSNDEQYEGQPTLQRILELLPDFEVMIDYGTDVLLKNKKLW